MFREIVCCVVQLWDVFDPYRGMKHRRQKQRDDTADTHGELFGEPPAPTVRKPEKNPERFTKTTPKITEVSTVLNINPVKFHLPLQLVYLLDKFESVKKIAASM